MAASIQPNGKLLARYLKSQWLLASLLAALLFSNFILQLINPQIMRRFIDTVQTGAAETLLRVGLLFIGVALVQQAVSVLATYVSENVGWTATNGLRADLAEHCLRLDMSFHNAHTPGEMIECIDGDVTALSTFFSQFVIQVFGSALLLVGVLVSIGNALAMALGAYLFLKGLITGPVFPAKYLDSVVLSCYNGFEIAQLTEETTCERFRTFVACLTPSVSEAVSGRARPAHRCGPRPGTNYRRARHPIFPRPG